MKALVKYAQGPGNVGVRDVAMPVPAADEVLIRVKYCGVCGTDLHIEADEFPNTPPVVMGHEFCGTVVETGAAVQGLAVGDRVVGELHTGACGECALCRAGKPHICDAKLALGSKRDGAFAEYLTLPAWLVHPIPEDIPWEVAGVTEPFAISAHCLLERGGLQGGQSVLITGSATMGLMATIWAHRVGAGPIIVSGTDQDAASRFGLARALGATRTVNVQRESLADAVAEASDGRGVDVWIECSGAPAAIAQGIDLLNKTGQAVLIGLVGSETIPVPWNTLLYKAAEAEEAPNLRRLVSAILPLDRWNEAFDLLRRGEAVKVLIQMEE